jgi:antitoxin component of RelBE/YafQ-DinJ toxin-antitoxin module
MKNDKSVVRVRIDTNTLNKLRALKQSCGVPVNQTIRIAIEKHLVNLQNKRNKNPF